MERTHLYRPLLKVAFGMTLASFIFFVFMLRPDNGMALLSSFALLGDKLNIIEHIYECMWNIKVSNLLRFSQTWTYSLRKSCDTSFMLTFFGGVTSSWSVRGRYVRFILTNFGINIVCAGADCESWLCFSVLIHVSAREAFWHKHE